MKRFLFFVTGLLVIFALNACNSFDSTEEEQNIIAYICIDAESARTIAPNFSVEKMSSFSLYGKKTENDEESYLGGGATYAELLDERVAVSTGTWYEFRLVSRLYDLENSSFYNCFSSVIANKEIVRGKNTLNFTLKVDEKESYGYGYVNVTFKIPSATAVKTGTVGLYDRETDKLCYGGHFDSNGNPVLSSLSFTLSEEDNSATSIYSARYPIGTYRLKAWFYADEECTLLVSTFNELIKVYAGVKSEAERDIDKLNMVYTITLNDAESYNEVYYYNEENEYVKYKPKTLYTRYEGSAIKLPTADKMENKPGYTFMGWYTGENGTGELVTEINPSQAENVVLYAKWVEGYWITTNSGWNWRKDNLSECTIYLMGEWTSEDVLRLGESLESSENKKINLDMSRATGITELPEKGDGCFYKCRNLVSVILPNKLTKIGNRAFSNCTSLTEVLIPATVTSIGSDAFYNCESLASITLPNGLRAIEYGTFSGCENLESINLPEGLTSIGYAAFDGCASLESINLPEGLTSIGDAAFGGCASLESIILPEGLTSIGYAAFGGCASLKSIELPDGLTSVKGRTFSACKSLSKITIPNSVTSIGEEAFSGCNKNLCLALGVGIVSKDYEYDKTLSTLLQNVKEIIINDGVESIGNNVFAKCSTLNKVTISESVKKIGECAFQDCSSLSEINIPSSVTTIKNVFYGCDKLSNVVFEDSNSEWYYYYNGKTWNLGKMDDPTKNADTLKQFAFSKIYKK